MLTSESLNLCDMMRFGIVRRGSIETAIHHPHTLPTMPCYGEWNISAEEDFPVATAMFGRILFLPMFPELTDGERDHVIQNLLRG